MNNYTLQYSHPTDKRIAISDWIEKTTVIKANDLKEAIKKANNKLQHLGTWIILDCWEGTL